MSITGLPIKSSALVSTIVVLFIGLAAPALYAAASGTKKVYYIHNSSSSVYRFDQNAPDPQPVTWNVPNAFSLAVHDCKMYWTSDGDIPSNNQGVIYRSNMDGSNRETVLAEGNGALQSLAIDPVAEKLYWGARTHPNGGSTFTFNRSNLDGSGIEPVLNLGDTYIPQLALDVAAGLMHWPHPGIGIRSANMDGSNVHTVIAAPDVGNIALDLSANHVYWTEYENGLIRRANLDGTNVQTISTPANGPTSVAIEPEAAKMYWFERGNPEQIRRANLDGSQVETIGQQYIHLTNFVFVEHDVDAACGPPDPCPPAMDCDAVEAIYWGTSSAGPSVPARIWRGNADGTGIQAIAETLGNSDPYSIALDPAGAKVYWTQQDTCACANAQQVFRANLDGSNVEPLIALPWVPNAPIHDIALDVSAGKMYFARGGNVTRIYRSNLDGTQIETFHLGPAGGLDMDSVNSKLYFSTSTTQMVRLSTNAGLQPPLEPIINTTGEHRFIGLDVPDGKLWWYEWLSNSPTAMRANLDGTSIEQLGNPEGNVTSFNRYALDAVNDRIYRIRNGNLDYPGQLDDRHIVRSNVSDGSDGFCLVVSPPVGIDDIALLLRPPCPADINGDDTVDVNDLLLLIGAWGSSGPTGDLNGDNIVDVNDLLLLIGGWGECK